MTISPTVVFCPPIAVFGSKERATEKELIAGPTLSVECDKGPENARLVLEQLLGSATLVVRSGGIWTDPTTSETQDKLHLHWRLAQPAKTTEGIQAPQASARARRTYRRGRSEQHTDLPPNPLARLVASERQAAAMRD